MKNSLRNISQIVLHEISQGTERETPTSRHRFIKTRTSGKEGQLLIITFNRIIFNSSECHSLVQIKMNWVTKGLRNLVPFKIKKERVKHHFDYKTFLYYYYYGWSITIKFLILIRVSQESYQSVYHLYVIYNR